MAQQSSASALGRPVSDFVHGRRLRWAPFVSLLVCALFAGGLVLGSVNAIESETHSCQPPVTPTHPFSDVGEDSFAYDAVACIYLLGVTTGTTPTTFSPDEYVTREQMASFMARLYQAVTGTEAPVVSTPFTDIPSDSFAQDDIARIYGLGITTGTTTTTYSPYFFVTREEMAAFLARLYRAVYDQQAPVVLTPFFDVPLDSFAYDDIGRIYGLGLTTGTTTTTYSPHLNVTREEMAAFLARFRQLPEPTATTTTTINININADDTADPPSPPQDDTSDEDTSDNEATSPRDIAFLRTSSNSTGEIWVMDEDGRNLKQITSTNNSAEDPTFSPDGTYIAYTAASATSILQIWVINADGSNPIQITEEPEDRIAEFSVDPSWSSDGQRIAYVSYGSNHAFEIFVMNADGSDPQQITSSYLHPRQPRWSPDDMRIAFTRTNGDNDRVLIIDADGTDLTYLSSASSSSNDPAWSPDGTKIAFASHQSGETEQIWVMDADGTNQTQITDDGYSNSEPAWSPDGRIIYVSNRGHDVKEEIWIMDADGTNQQAVTSDARNELDRQPTWSPSATDAPS